MMRSISILFIAIQMKMAEDIEFLIFHKTDLVKDAILQVFL